MKTLAVITLLIAGLSASAQDFSTRITAELQTAGPQSLRDLTWQQGTTPLISVEPVSRNRPIGADSNTVVRMIIGPTSTATYFAVITNQTITANAYRIQWPTVGTNTAGAAWWYTVYFEANGSRYWSGNGRLFIEATTSTAEDGLVWQDVTTGSVDWANIVGDPASSTSLVAYVAEQVVSGAAESWSEYPATQTVDLDGNDIDDAGAIAWAGGSRIEENAGNLDITGAAVRVTANDLTWNGQTVAIQSDLTDAVLAQGAINTNLQTQISGIEAGALTNVGFGLVGDGGAVTLALDTGVVAAIVSDFMPGSEISNRFYLASNPSNYVRSVFPSSPNVEVMSMARTNAAAQVGINDWGIGPAVQFLSTNFPVVGGSVVIRPTTSGRFMLYSNTTAYLSARPFDFDFHGSVVSNAIFRGDASGLVNFPSILASADSVAGASNLALSVGVTASNAVPWPSLTGAVHAIAVTNFNWSAKAAQSTVDLDSLYGIANARYLNLVEVGPIVIEPNYSLAVTNSVLMWRDGSGIRRTVTHSGNFSPSSYVTLSTFGAFSTNVVRTTYTAPPTSNTAHGAFAGEVRFGATNAFIFHPNGGGTGTNWFRVDGRFAW